MIFPFEFSVAYAGTPIIKKPFDTTDNLVLAEILANLTEATDALKLASVGLVIPTVSVYLTGYRVTVDVAAKVEFGIVTAGGTFTRLYPEFATYAVAGGIVREMGQNGPILRYDAIYTPAIRVTGAANGTIQVTGDLGIFPRS